ncbi:mitochondrial nucleoid factor 1 [Planoprotostelium fungivorum]|uniref:Kinase n=1 Tax=Planoprotostelium fungivorum TaxID=1890364 RepID=A0A2P6N766_9EUKA|nr:mitochondrial nucleoid factor 1 [Planoprotostelium fungivorum]
MSQVETVEQSPSVPKVFNKQPDLNKIPPSHPFQVSGHGALLKLPEDKVCKPLIERELAFYESLDSQNQLVPFVSTFHGTLELELPKDKVQRWIDEIQEAETSGEDEQHQNSPNPWALKISRKTFTSLLKTHNEERFFTRYLVLGDLTSRFHHPSICDIKIGTRQYGDDATPDKRSRHMRKCAATTSGQIGVRLCGQVVWQPSTRTYTRVDKYQGRSMSIEVLKKTISNFFWNGKVYNTSILLSFIQKLKILHKIAQTELNYRLYSTSLLLLYEGSENPSYKDVGVDIKMIDFAHAFPKSGKTNNDDGYAYGLGNLIQILENTYDEKKLSHPPAL